MERLNKFDEAIKGKIGALEGEPSARVWAGVRAEIGDGLSYGKYAWLYKVGAAAAVLLLLGIGVVVKNNTRPQGQEATTVGVDSANPNKKPLEIIKQQQDDPWMVDDSGMQRDEHKKNRKVTDRDLQGMMVNWPNPNPQIANQEGPELQDLPREAPQRNTIQNDLNQQSPVQRPDRFVDAPTREGSKDQKERAPELKPDRKEVMAQNDEPGKRKRRVPTPRDLQIDKLREKSPSILATLASGAKKYLGMDTEYRQEVKEDKTTSAFYADFGLFKVRRVKSKKTGK